MKYEYKPYQLESWIKQHRQTRPRIEHEEWEQKKHRGILERLSEEFQNLEGTSEFDAWVEDQTRREKRLIPYLYTIPDLDESWKVAILEFVKQNVTSERHTFRVMLDVLYQTCDVDVLWYFVRSGYEFHAERIEKRMDDKQVGNWRNWLLSSQPAQYLADVVHREDRNFQEVLEDFYLGQHLPFFRLVFLEILQKANEQFFIKEQKLFEEFFAVSNTLEQQSMADSLIRNCARLNQVKTLGKFIYEKMKTYMRRPGLWQHVGEKEKARFAQWIFRMELKDFFDGVNKNHERFQYWKKFIVKLHDVVITDKKSPTLIMYFRDVVVVEVLGTGDVYIYEKAVFDEKYRKKIDKMLEAREFAQQKNWIHVPEVRREELLDISSTINREKLSHHYGWKPKFDGWLRSNLGWEVREDVLLQEEAERDEGEFDTE